KRLSIKPASPFDAGQIAFSHNLIRSIYQEAGFAEVQVSTRVEAVTPRSVDVHFHIVEGPLYRVQSITIEGNRAISEKLVRRDLGIKPGDPFSQSRIYEANKQLFLSGYFETI